MDILLDPFHDLRSGYFFSINARGVQLDGIISETTGGESGFELIEGNAICTPVPSVTLG